MNIAAITGRMTKNPELKETKNGVKICTFTIAIERPEIKDMTDFVDCVAWRNTAEFVCSHFRKGDGIEINGTLTTRTYEAKDSGKRKVTEVLCNHISFPKVKKQLASAEYSQQDITAGDMPF